MPALREAVASKHKNEFKRSSGPLVTKEQVRLAVDKLLMKLCVEGGFCGDPQNAQFDRSRVSWTADDFAVEVLRAEGLEPMIIEGFGPSRSEYFIYIRAEFVAAFRESINGTGLKD